MTGTTTAPAAADFPPPPMAPMAPMAATTRNGRKITLATSIVAAKTTVRHLWLFLFLHDKNDDDDDDDDDRSITLASTVSTAGDDNVREGVVWERGLLAHLLRSRFRNDDNGRGQFLHDRS
jgi:hypothetical protein